MPPTVILIRHAQALHNVNHKYHPHNPTPTHRPRSTNILSQDYTLRDPELSALGREQCAELTPNLKEKLPADLDIGLMLCSPMRRTCETAILSLGWLIAQGIPIKAHAGWQENSEKPCDTGSPRDDLSKEFSLIDFDEVDEVYPDKSDEKYWYQKDKLLARAQSVLEDLYHRPEKAVIVVSHSAFMRECVTGDHFFNADYRIYDFEEREEGATAPYQLKQWELTKDTGGLGRSSAQPVPIGTGLPVVRPAPGEDVPLPEGVQPN